MKAKQVITSVVAFALTLAVSATSVGFNSVDVQAAKASNMKVESFEGKVTLKNSKGKAKTIKTGTRLLSGDNLATKTESTANILLDDSKAALVEESSQVSVKQSGKDLDLIVDKGSVFFDVSKKLTSKESFEIKTSNIVCGIRGTIGEVGVKTNKKKKLTQATVYLLEGQVTVKYQYSKKKMKTKTVEAGQKMTVSTNDKTGVSIVNIVPIVSTDIKKSVAKKLQTDEALMTRVQTACPDINWTSTIADALEGKHESIAETFPEGLEKSTAKDKWKPFYKDIINNPSKIMPASNKIFSYSLIDLDADKIPELIIDTDEQMRYPGFAGTMLKSYVISYTSADESKFEWYTHNESNLLDEFLYINGAPYKYTLLSDGVWVISEVTSVLRVEPIISGDAQITFEMYTEYIGAKVKRVKSYTSASSIKKAIDKYKS